MKTDLEPSRRSADNIFTFTTRTNYHFFDLFVLFFSLMMTVAAFVLNMGWVRFMLFFLLLPPLLVGVHFVVGILVFWRKGKSNVFYALCNLHPITYLLLPDISDSGPEYVFFSIIDAPTAILRNWGIYLRGAYR